MKKCISCGTEFDDSALFCAVCGNRLDSQADVSADEPAPDAPVEEATVDEPSAIDTAAERDPAAMEPDEAVVEPAVEPEPDNASDAFVEDYVTEIPVTAAPTFGVYHPKAPRSGWWKILLGIVAIFLAVIMVSATILTVYVPMLFTYEYSKGEVSDGAYANEFADLYFNLGTNWKEAPKSEYKACESANGENCECGLFVTRDSTELIVMYISGAQGSTAEDILNESAKQYKDEGLLEDALRDEILGAAGDTYGSIVSVEVISVGKIEEIEIADADYGILSVEYDITVNGRVTKVHRSICARVIDDYAVIIQATSDTERGVESAIKSFKTIPLEYYYSHDYGYEIPDEVSAGY